MGNVGSRQEDGAALILRDQIRLSIASITVTNSRRKVLLNVVPNAYPASRILARKEGNDESPIIYVQVATRYALIATLEAYIMQDPESSSVSPLPTFIPCLSNEDDLDFMFTFVIRQTQSIVSGASDAVDTFVNGLTFAFASSNKDLDNLVTREFHADPNLHKNSNVELVGDFSTNGNPSMRFEWSWKWRPPKLIEDRGGGWRNTCSFVEYDQKAHRLSTLATFTFWVQNNQPPINSPPPGTPAYELKVPPRLRLPSSQSMQSGFSESDQTEYIGPPSPIGEMAEEKQGLAQTTTKDTMKIDIACVRPGEDMSATEDGPLFRATMKALEQKTGNMRLRMKKVLRKAEAAQAAQLECNEAVAAFTEALREACASNANAVQPALEHYFEKIAKAILQYEKQNTVHLRKLIIDPLSKLYNIDIKQAEAKKKDFEDESKDYYAYVSRYLGQRQDSLKEKKRNESDSKYQTKRRNFELKRFDYSSFMQDLHGGRKEQEVLSCLTRYADTQAKSYLLTANKVEEMTPQLEALINEVNRADKEFQFQRTEREEKRRNLEKSTTTYIEPEAGAPSVPPPPASTAANGSYASDSEMSRSDSIHRNGLHYSSSVASQHGPSLTVQSPNVSNGVATNSRPNSASYVSPDKFKGFRDLEEKDHSSASGSEKVQHRKEGLLWALSRPGSHVDPKGLNKQAWHKFWIVLDQGKLSEYSNWKQRLDLHMEPIDLRMASVREARNAERRFCFEVITPQYKRVYQAPSEEDMHSWINALNNALQNAVESRGRPQSFTPSSNGERTPHRDIGSVLTGKSSSYSGHHTTPSHASNVPRRITVGARPIYVRSESNSFGENPSKLLQTIRDNDQGNCWCADCGSGSKVEWVSINLGIVLCIECSGIHRSLGTHISKVRSLTLDTTSFTTDVVELLLLVGNRISNMVWEATLTTDVKPPPHANRDRRLQFIVNKYVDKAYVQPITSALSHYSTPDETLLASVKKNDIQGVLYALALSASPNAADRSRNTHCIFLALAAADPAAPAGAAPSLNVRSTSMSNKHTPQSVTAFPIAELLVQNGGILPTTLPAFPLSANAQLYIEQKSAKDTLGELPLIGKGGLEKPGEATKLQKKIGPPIARKPL